MKKIFTLISMAVMAVSVNAQKILVSFPTEGDVKGWTISGSTTESTVKIHQNSDAVDCLKLANGYTSDGVSNGNHIELTCEGGFKKGDVVTIAGAVSIKETDVDRLADVYFYEYPIEYERYINSEKTVSEIKDCKV